MTSTGVERRGWDKMFYPSKSHGIENSYLKPVLKNLRKVTGFVANPDGLAFCCSKTMEELTDEGSIGALNWIKKFENGVNEKGKPLKESLKKSNHHWYEMKADTVADLIATINYGQTLVIAKMRERSFVNQRLIRFTANDDDVDIDLCHALMNSYIGLFYVEALGFGRGLGALDLSSTKIKENYYMLDPRMLTNFEKRSINDAFSLIGHRSVKALPIEVFLDDRKTFEKTVASAYKLEEIWEDIKDSLLELYNIRMSVL